jgi:UDP-N-acetylglucosamine 2-epimerase (non-hydrolysing)
MLRVMCVLGTRPEAIKMAPVIQELARHSGAVVNRVCATGQHRQMFDEVLSLFGIVPDYDLDVMQQAQLPIQIAATVLAKLEHVLTAEQPDWVLVQGDTTTAMAAALAAFYNKVRVGHVEAGLRSYDKTEPFPEEINRRIAGTVADLHFAPTKRACENLLRENVPAENILLTGNPIVDALFAIAELPYNFDSGQLTGIPRDKRILLVTAHRRENFGQPLEMICRALRRIAGSYHSSAHIVYPVHLNPNVWGPVHRMLAGTPGITLLPPLSYPSLVKLLKQSYLVLTDSGGLQEEAPYLGKPVLVLRNITERPEAVEAGTSRLVGLVAENIVDETARLLDNEQAYQQMAEAVHCYGDGKAAQRIVSGLLKKERRVKSLPLECLDELLS